MDDYQKFVVHHLSQLRRETKNDQLPKPECFQIGHGTSLIRFHGRPILPPLLSGKQRVEMQRHKVAAQRAVDQRKSLAEARMTHLNNIPHTVKLRQAPTLEDFFQGKTSLTEARTSGINSVSTCQSSDVNEVKGIMSLSPPSVLIQDEKESVCVPPFTSTAHSTLSISHLFSPQVQNNQKVLCNEGQAGETYSSDLVRFSTGQCCKGMPSQPASDPLADVSHQSLSSGYVTYENAGNASCFSDQIESGDVRLRLDIEDPIKNNSTVFLRKASNTIGNMADIVSHPPTNGEELEGTFFSEASPIYKAVTVSSAAEDIYDPSSWGDDIIANEPEGELVTSSLLCSDEALPRPIGGSECSPLGSTITHPSQIMYCSRQDRKTFMNVNPDPAIETVQNTSPSNSSESFKKVTSDGSSTTDQLPLQNQAVDRRQPTVVNDDFEALEGPYRQSLQTLLKKSQEHRRRQKQLRNQAKNSRMQEPQQTREVEEEEHGFSDKENKELSLTGVTATERRTTKEEEENKPRRVEVNDKEKNERKSPGLSVEEWTSTTPTGDDKPASKTWTGVERDTWTGVEKDLAFKGITLHFSPEAPVESGVIVDHVSQPRLTLPAVDSTVPFYLAKEHITACGLPKTYYLGRGRFQNIPVPKFCMSPVRHTRIGVVHEEASDCDRGGAPKRKLLVNTALNVESEYCSEVALRERHQDVSVSPTVPPLAGSDKTAPLARSSQQAEQIALLEMNLSSLKALISDLESTLTEAPEGQTLGSQPDRSHAPIDVHYPHTDHSTDSAHEDNTDYDQWEEMRQSVRDRSAVEGKQDDSEEQRSRFPDGYDTTLQSPGDEENRGGDGGGEVTVADAAPSRVYWSDRGAASQQALLTSRGPPQPSAKRPVTSRAQKMRVPDAFREVLRKVSVLSDHSNQPLEREAETAAYEGDSSCHSLSLNQSYDVDTPSGLWPKEDTASDSRRSKGGAPQGQQLTPEVEAGQGGASRAKRRLVMHAAGGGKAGRWPRGEGGEGALVRPQASTPKASPQSSRGLGSQMDMHQQLKQTHAAQVKALQEEQRRQQLELLQTLAARYHVLQRMSFPYPTSSSRLGDVSTPLPPSPSPPPPPPPCSGSPPHTRLVHPVASISQPWVSVAECYRPLVAAAVKGFLARRVLRTERVGQLLRTIKDTQRFLQAFQPQTPGRGEFSSRQDMALQERVTLQLRSARYEFHDIFFSQSVGERMQIISWDRELIRERQLKLQKEDPVQPKGRTSLSAATQKALDRRRGEMIQGKVVGRQRSLGPEAGCRVELSSEEQCEPKRGQFKANPRRVPKTTPSCRRTR